MENSSFLKFVSEGEWRQVRVFENAIEMFALGDICVRICVFILEWPQYANGCWDRSEILMSGFDAIAFSRWCMTVFTKVDLKRCRHAIHDLEIKYKYLKYFLSFKAKFSSRNPRSNRAWDGFCDIVESGRRKPKSHQAIGINFLSKVNKNKQ